MESGEVRDKIGEAELVLVGLGGEFCDSMRLRKIPEYVRGKELLQEAGLRLPDPIGDTVSIIGALIVGQSAVEAKVISPIAVIVVATAGIAGYAQPSQDLGAALRVCRFALVIAAIAAGLYGVVLALALTVWYLCTIDSFGRNYTAPWSGGGRRNLRRTFLRSPLPDDKFREPELRTPDRRKQA